MRVEPEHAPGDTVEAMRRRLALAVRDELERRKRQMAVMTYDDLLTRLDDTLTGPGGEAAAKRLRERYRVVLVDEFQDTDPVQWDIMLRAFGDGDTTLVLIGDPKQAIYAFRGADVYAYLEAANRADKRATLEVNWRSDQGLIDAYDALLGGAKLGHEGIVYRRVRAADANQTPRLSDAPVAAPLRIRVVHRDEPSLKLTRGGSVSNATRARARRQGPRGRPRHPALLERARSRSARRTARSSGANQSVPATSPSSSAPTATPRSSATPSTRSTSPPSSTARAASSAPRRRATGCACSRRSSARRRHNEPPRPRSRRSSAGRRSASPRPTEEDREELHRRLHQWARVLRVKGVASLTETVTLVEGLPSACCGRVDGERELTDLRHVGQLLHAAATTEQMGAAALTSWLRQQIAAAGEDTSDEERSRRLESDAEAVQVLTIHRSKGVEFPIVYYPYLWEPGWIPDDPQPVFFHDPQAGDERVIDVGMDGPDFPRPPAPARGRAARRGPAPRLRRADPRPAPGRRVVGAARGTAATRALGRLLFARDAEGNVAADGPATPSDARRRRPLRGARRRGARVRQRRARDARRWPRRGPASAHGGGARLRGRASTATSTGAGGAPPTATSPPAPTRRGWRASPRSASSTTRSDARGAAPPRRRSTTTWSRPAMRGVPSLLAEMPAGVAGRHLRAPRLRGDRLRRPRPRRRARRARRGDPGAAARRRRRPGDRVVAGLRAAIETPLGPLLGGRALRDLARADRLDELDLRAAAGRRRPADRAR